MDNLGDEIQKYICALYSQKDVVEVNVARHNQLKLGKFAEENLPPNDDARYSSIFCAVITKHSS